MVNCLNRNDLLKWHLNHRVVKGIFLSKQYSPLSKLSNQPSLAYHCLFEVNSTITAELGRDLMRFLPLSHWNFIFLR